MRRSAAPSELRLLVAPLGRLLDAAWRRMHWWVAAMAFLYAVSGITVIGPDEVGVVERWGRVVGDSPATREHGPGLLFAFPKPVDQVVRVKTRNVRELPVRLAPSSYVGTSATTLDPLTVGYALTGDQNIVHVQLVARFRVHDAAEWAFYGPPSEEIVRTEVIAATVRSLGEMDVDRVLSDQRKDLIKAVTRRAQAGLDAAGSGLELVSLELTDLSPPVALRRDFEAVQSAYIGAETQKKDAQAFAQDIVPKANASANTEVQSARADAATDQARAQGDANAFLALEREYRADPAVVRERLYRDGVERAVASAGAVRWLPPPAGGDYHGLRVLVAPEPQRPPSESNRSTVPLGRPPEELP
ncbi:MAG TPA: protease modulator HflK [Candidatus Eisenbacteria bacterium]|nr:protease modulator HflK [Candidatus Eisenbacteria bacterium]